MRSVSCLIFRRWSRRWSRQSEEKWLQHVTSAVGGPHRWHSKLISQVLSKHERRICKAYFCFSHDTGFVQTQGRCSSWNTKENYFKKTTCRNNLFFFSCIAERARDIVGQLLEIRKRCETQIECRIFTGKPDKANKQTNQNKANKQTNKHKTTQQTTCRNKNCLCCGGPYMRHRFSTYFGFVGFRRLKPGRCFWDVSNLEWLHASVFFLPVPYALEALTVINTFCFDWLFPHMRE